MRIPANVILIWAGLNSNIPSGYTRETSLDGKYPKAWGSVNPNVIGGAPSHTHTSPAHSHTLANHTHTYTLTANSTTLNSSGGGGLMESHTHGGTSGGVSGGTTGSTAVTYGSCSNDPPYYTVIFIKSGGATGLPNNVIALFDKTSIPSGWHECNGLNGTPDLRNRYLKGASTGADAGTTGGSTTNVHDITHTHSVTPHSHVAANSGGPSGSQAAWGNFGNFEFSTTTHVHSVTLDNATQNINSYTGSLTTPETVEPLHKKVIAIQNQTGYFSKPKYIIGLWLGNTSDIPKGWVLCDGNNGTLDLRNYFIKIANDTSHIGHTGGSNTHTHAAQSHSHTGSGTHSHTGTCGDQSSATQRSSAPENAYASKAHTHSVSNVQSVTANYDSANTTADVANNEPEYRTVAYIQFQKEIYGAAALSNFI